MNVRMQTSDINSVLKWPLNIRYGGWGLIQPSCFPATLRLLQPGLEFHDTTLLDSPWVEKSIGTKSCLNIFRKHFELPRIGRIKISIFFKTDLKTISIIYLRDTIQKKCEKCQNVRKVRKA